MGEPSLNKPVCNCAVALADNCRKRNRYAYNVTLTNDLCKLCSINLQVKHTVHPLKATTNFDIMFRFIRPVNNKVHLCSLKNINIGSQLKN